MPFPKPEEFSQGAPELDECGFRKGRHIFLDVDEIKATFATTDSRQEAFKEWQIKAGVMAALHPNQEMTFAFVGDFVRASHNPCDLPEVYVLFENCQTYASIKVNTGRINWIPFDGNCKAGTEECKAYREWIEEYTNWTRGCVWTKVTALGTAS